MTATTGARDIMVVRGRDTIGRGRTTIATAVGTIGATAVMITTPVALSRHAIETVIARVVALMADVAIEMERTPIPTLVVTVAFVWQATEIAATPASGDPAVARVPRMAM